MDTVNLLKFIGTKIKELRIKNQFSQEELGAKLGLSKHAIAKYEAGIRDAGQDNLFSLAEIFNVPIDYFFPNQKNTHTEVLQEYDADALEVAELLHKEGYGELNILFQKTKDLSDEKKRQLVKILKATLPEGDDMEGC